MVDGRLLSAIHAASLNPERWPEALELISVGCGAKGAVLHVHTRLARRWTASPSARDIFERYLADGWPNRSDRVGRGIRMNRAGFITDSDLYSEAEMGRQPVYQEFLIPRGLAASAGTHVGGAVDGELVLSVWGFPDHAASNAKVPWLDALRPELARSCVIAAEMELMRARSAVDALAAINKPAALLGQYRNMLASNDLFRHGLPEFGHEGYLGLHLRDASADAKLGSSLERVGGLGATIPLRLPENGRAVLHVLPAAGFDRDLTTGIRALLVLTKPKLSHSPTASLIATLYDLTAAEARLAQALAEDLTLEAAASRLGVAIATARSQLHKVFDKTGVHSQAELLVLLSQYELPVSSGF